jgi:hypothetical protein
MLSHAATLKVGAQYAGAKLNVKNLTSHLKFGLPTPSQAGFIGMKKGSTVRNPQLNEFNWLLEHQAGLT